MHIPRLSAVGVLATFASGAPVSEAARGGLVGKRDESGIFLAARQLVSFYDSGAANDSTGIGISGGQGVFKPSGQSQYWQSATALAALVEYQRVTGDTTFEWVLDECWDVHKNDTDWFKYDNDDFGWWGQAWLRAFQVTNNERYLDSANKVVEYMNQASWDHAWTCESNNHHGLTWSAEGTNSAYKQSIANSLNLELLATLGAMEKYRNVTGFDMLVRARETVDWFKDSGILTAAGVVGDGYRDGPAGACDMNPYAWTYNQGQLINGLVALSEATSDDSYMALARKIGDAMLKTLTTTGDDKGILREGCEETGCSTNANDFKAAGIHGLARLNRKLTDHPYTLFIKNNLASMQAHARKNDDQFEKDRFGYRWTGPYADAEGNGMPAQVAALELFNAAEQQE